MIVADVLESSYTEAIYDQIRGKVVLKDIHGHRKNQLFTYISIRIACYRELQRCFSEILLIAISTQTKI